MLLAISVCAFAQTDDGLKYRRNALAQMMVYHSEDEFGKEIYEAFMAMPLSDKYDDHDVGFAVVDNDSIPNVKKRSHGLVKAEFGKSLNSSDVRKNAQMLQNILNQAEVAKLMVAKWFGLDIDPDDFDINFPDTAYLSTGMMLSEKTGFAFQLGKGSRNIGDTMMGSVIWSDYLTGVSYGQLEFYCPVFKYTGTVSQFNVDKYVYAHQIDARFFKKFQLTVFEGLLVYAPLELRYLNPWTILHGWAAWRDYEPDEDDPESHTCDYMGVKAQFAPVDNLRIYGLFAMTQFQTAYERSNCPCRSRGASDIATSCGRHSPGSSSCQAPSTPLASSNAGTPSTSSFLSSPT